MFTNLFLIHFQTKGNDMHAYANSWLSHDGARTQQPAFEPISFVTHFAFVNKPIHPCKFFVLANFLQAGEGNQENNQPSSLFLL